MAKYIDADKLTDILNHALRWFRKLNGDTKPEQRLLQYIKAKIEKMPAEPVEHIRTGCWVEDDCGNIRCSKCNHKLGSPELSLDFLYCPLCGSLNNEIRLKIPTYKDVSKWM